MTVTQVLGCGMQKGRPEYYRGVEMETSLLPKIEVDIVVCKIPVRTVIDAAKMRCIPVISAMARSSSMMWNRS